MSWVQESIFYHIYPLGFCGAPDKNEGGEVTPRITKIKEWIPHLKKMEVNAVYLGPIFDSSEHGYDTKDYYKLDTRLGTNEDFAVVCEALHENGIRVVLDGVFNHVGREFWAFQDVQKNGQNSKYCGWFHNLNFGGNSPCGDAFWYEGWQGHYNLVKLNLRNPEVVDHLLGAVSMWMDKFHIDGLRLDAADCVDGDFFRRLRSFCKERDPDFWLMGEIIHGDYNYWANPSMLDSVTNYECHKGLYSSHNDKNYFEIGYSLNRQFGNGGIYKNICLYNFADNHDVNRVASFLKNRAHLPLLYTILYAMPGVPSIYYGSEWGICGERDRFSDKALRPCLELDQIPEADKAFFQYICRLGKVRRALPALQYGAYEQSMLRNEQFVFCRWTNEQRVYIALNLADHPEYIEFPACAGRLVDILTGTAFESNDGNYKLEMPAYGIRIFSMPEVFLNLDDAETGSDKRQVTADVQPAPQKPDNIQEAEPLKEEKEILPGRYRHFKGGEYEVIGIAHHSETKEEMVVYRALYGEGGLWVRPAAMFRELVEADGKKCRRFERIGGER